ncbi:MAG TPA: hypothetical protein VFO98_15330 [Marmoricola sp.]|jgi:hypothetical protein|nr:hypothetical protein [Marmoricola sp.]
MSILEEVPTDQPLVSRAARALAPERLEHIRIFAELATDGIGPTRLPFVPRKTFTWHAPAPQLRLILGS